MVKIPFIWEESGTNSCAYLETSRTMVSKAEVTSKLMPEPTWVTNAPRICIRKPQKFTLPRLHILRAPMPVFHFPFFFVFFLVFKTFFCFMIFISVSSFPHHLLLIHSKMWNDIFCTNEKELDNSFVFFKFFQALLLFFFQKHTCTKYIFSRYSVSQH